MTDESRSSERSHDEHAGLARWASALTPNRMALGMLAHVALWWACRWYPIEHSAEHSATLSEARAFWKLAEGVVRYGGMSIACLTMMVLTLVIAREHRATRRLNFAWLALTAHAGVALVRAWIEFSLYYYDSYPLGRWWMGFLMQVVVVGGTLLVLLSMLAMVQAYQLVGLGLKLERQDWLIAALALALLPMLLTYRNEFTEAGSPLVFTRYLQQLGIYLLPVAAMVGLVLQRQTARMGGGQLASALRWLTAYVLTRAILVLAAAWIQDLPHPLSEFNTLLSALITAAGQAALWLAVIATAKRAAMIFSALSELQKNFTTRRLTVSVETT